MSAEPQHPSALQHGALLHRARRDGRPRQGGADSRFRHRRAARRGGTVDLRRARRDGAADRGGAARRGTRAGRPAPHPAPERQRLRADVLRRDRGGNRADRGFAAAHGGGSARSSWKIPALRRSPRPTAERSPGRTAGSTAVARAHQGGVSPPRLRRHGGGRSGVPDLHVGHQPAAEGRSPRTAQRLGAAADLRRLVRHHRRATSCCTPERSTGASRSALA